MAIRLQGIGLLHGDLQSINQIKNIYLGIDFGTSYTKVSFSTNAPNEEDIQIDSIEWDNDYLKRTVLYLKDDKLYFNQPSGVFREVKYFKYSIINDSLKNTQYETKNPFERLCCVYFLAHIIKLSLDKAADNYHLNDLSNCNVYINMGVPLENFYNAEGARSKGLYERILKDAVCLAGGSKIDVELPTDEVLISSLDEAYSELNEKEPFLKYKVSLFPELAAEILLYQQSKSVSEGVYAIIDIGGGTVDMAIFEKSKDSLSKNFHFLCHGQQILPLGIEILENEDKRNAEEQYTESFFRLVVTTAKHEGNKYVELKAKKRTFDVFFLGGGAENEWYTEKIKKESYRLKGIIMSELVYPNIDKYITDNASLLKKNQRLIISQMLARHPNDISSINGYPDYFKETKKEQIKDNSYSMADKLEDIQIERYGSL